MADIRRRVRIYGDVQGVCFRVETKREADSYGVKGWVKNNMDGAVEAMFEGEEKAVSSLLDWCRKGPLLARVERLEEEKEPLSGKELSFEIKH